MKCEECKYFDKTERICYYMGENRCVDNEEQTEDAISRQAAIDAVNIGNLHPGIVGALQSILADLPPVTAQPKTGHWKYAEPLQALQVEICSCCGCIKGNYFFSDIEVPIKFCPNCGTKMVEPQESEDI